MTEKVISCVLDVRFVQKVGKYVVKLAFPDERAKEYWLTEKQLSRLETAFDRTPHQHSTSKKQVIGYFNEKNYYCWCRFYVPPFEPPTQFDLRDLEDSYDE